MRMNMKHVSDVIRDQPEPPINRAMWWIEWVMRNDNQELIEKLSTHDAGFNNSIHLGVLLALFSITVIFLVTTIVQNLTL